MQDDAWADEERLRDGVLALVAAAETDQDFGNIGAAVLEYVVTTDEDRLRWLEAQALVSEPFVGRSRTFTSGASTATT